MCNKHIWEKYIFEMKMSVSSCLYCRCRNQMSNNLLCGQELQQSLNCLLSKIGFVFEFDLAAGMLIKTYDFFCVSQINKVCVSCYRTRADWRETDHWNKTYMDQRGQYHIVGMLLCKQSWWDVICRRCWTFGHNINNNYKAPGGSVFQCPEREFAITANDWWGTTMML